MEVRHEIEDADEYAETYRHRETDDGKADTEEYAHNESHHALSTDVTVEGTFNVVHKLLPERSVILREDLYPVVGKFLIVKEYEEGVEEYYTRTDKAIQEGECLGHELDDFWCRSLEDIGKVLRVEEGVYLMTICHHKVV